MMADQTGAGTHECSLHGLVEGKDWAEFRKKMEDMAGVGQSQLGMSSAEMIDVEEGLYVEDIGGRMSIIVFIRSKMDLVSPVISRCIVESKCKYSSRLV